MPGSIARAAIVVLLAVALDGCGVFGGGDDEELEPLELVDIDETLDVRRVWSEKVGGGSEFLRVGLSPSGDGQRVFAASYDGNVAAFNPDSGDRLWRNELDYSFRGAGCW